MRLSIGPWSVERQHGKPYLVDGYQLEPTAWVVRGGTGAVVVPQEGEPAAHYWAFALVRPSTVRVTDPLGRRYTLGFTRRRQLLRWLMAFVAAVCALGAWQVHHRFLGARHDA